jgi:hypothetical protein
VIGKVIRGSDAGRLLYYLYGPGKANEHVDPYLVAGFFDPGELEPERRPDGSRDFRRLSELLAQPLAALAGPGYDKPVWHCSVRAAPGDRILSDAEWTQVAEQVMDRTGLAREGDDLGVRWVAVRHAADHIHLVATLARQDGTRPKIWNDFYRVREACRAAETRLGLTATAPADRTAARRPSRAETEQAARRGWAEPPRVTLRREVSAAAAGARTEQEFFTGLTSAGVAVRQRHSVTNPGDVTGYAVGLRHHTAKDGGIVWYGGGKLAADLTLPKLRRRWTGTSAEHGAFPGRGLSAAAARGVLRNTVTVAAEQARDEAGFFAGLREVGVLVRLRFSEINPGQVNRILRRPARPCWRRRAAVVVRRGTAVGQADPAPPAGTLGSVPENDGGSARGVPVHRGGTRRDLPARGPPGHGSCGAHPLLHPARSGTRGRCGVGGGRHAARRSARSRQPGAAPRCQQL